ncbi:MAG: branched-chain amino acid ABC transporter permease [Actinomycetota bacterium]|nr:branched-chain amino acid ABC transporter permease [Actinomycetota bacterium]
MGFLRDLFVNVVLTTPLVGAYTMFALGIVFIYRGSRVLNLAHGAMAMFPAYIAYALTGVAGPYAGALIALAAGGVLGLSIERVLVRRLRPAGPTAQTVGTVAALGILIALAARIWGTTPIHAKGVFPDKSFAVGNSALSLGGIALFFIAIAVAGGFIALFRYTDLGLAMRCSADNRRAAALMGIDPERTTAVAWLFAGALAALGGVLLAASTNLHPYTLSLQVLPAFVAALIGGLENVSGALYGSILVGFTVGIVPSLGGIGKQTGAPQVALAFLAFIVMGMRGGRFAATDVRSGL